jgi:hypothetical protein
MMPSAPFPALAVAALSVSMLTLLGVPSAEAQSQAAGRRGTARTEETRVPVVFSGGYETDPRDRGRPVILIAAALGVPDEVFRAAFRNVRPAPAGQEPDPAQVRRNKAALLGALARYGVTNERLDEVSNYYRYNGRRGETWRHRPAAAYATVRGGKVTGFTLTDPGAGYSSAPTVSLPGSDGVSVRATLSFGPDFDKNGSLKELRLSGAPDSRAR